MALILECVTLPFPYDGCCFGVLLNETAAVRLSSPSSFAGPVADRRGVTRGEAGKTSPDWSRRPREGQNQVPPKDPVVPFEVFGVGARRVQGTGVGAKRVQVPFEEVALDP